MLVSMQHILEERKQLAHDLFQSTIDFSFAKMINIMTRLCSFYEDKDRKCNNYEEDVKDQTN